MYQALGRLSPESLGFGDGKDHSRAASAPVSVTPVLTTRAACELHSKLLLLVQWNERGKRTFGDACQVLGLSLELEVEGRVKLKMT